MSDSDVEIVDERPIETVVIIDQDDDDDFEIKEANERHDVIQIDEPLGKSSNIPSPRTDTLDEGDEEYLTAQSIQGEEEREDKHDNDHVKRKEYWLDMSSDPGEDFETKADSMFLEDNQVDKTWLRAANEAEAPKDQDVDTNKIPNDVSEQPQAEEKEDVKIEYPGEVYNKNEVASQGRSLEAKIPDATATSTSPGEPQDNQDISKKEPGSAVQASENETEKKEEVSGTNDVTSKRLPQEVQAENISSRNNTATTTAEVKEENKGNTAEVSPEDTAKQALSGSTEVKDTSTESQDTQQNAIAVPSTTRAPSLSIEDDFFSMSYTPMIPEVRKKKKKKVKRKISPEPKTKKDIPSESSDTAIASAELPQVTSSSTVASTISQATPNETKESPRKKKRLTRPVTPPPVDEEQFKKTFLEQRPVDVDVDFGDDDTMFDENEEIRRKLDLLGQITQGYNSTSDANKNGDDSSRENSDQPSLRDYVLHVTSFLPGSENNALDINVKGTKKFHAIVSKVLKYFLSLNIVPQEYHNIYRGENMVLYWNKIRIQDFMRPDSLSIPAPTSGEPTSIELGLYTKAQAAEIERYRVLEREEKYRLLAQKEAEAEREKDLQQSVDLSDPDQDLQDLYKDDELFKSIEDEAGPGITSREATDLGNLDKEEEGYFKIGLKGEDNKKITVRVHAETKISVLVKHFLHKKGLPLTTEVKVVFDDEDVDINGTVGDTELEEDFTVDMLVVKKKKK